jgi:CRP/FNR family cyclic AMP-dependent transcriptional regulator
MRKVINSKVIPRKSIKVDERTNALKKIDLFSSMTPNELLEIRNKIIIKSYSKNEIILREEQTSQYMYMILDGEVRVVQTTDEGKEILVTVHQAGDFFGELSLIDGKTAPAAVYAAKHCVTAIISKTDFFSLLFSQNKVLESLLKILCSRLRDAMKKIQILNFNNASQRIKMLFLMLSESYGEKVSEGTVLKLKLIHQNIAAMTGLSRETVTRILDKWQRSGEVKILKNKNILLKPEFDSIPL